MISYLFRFIFISLVLSNYVYFMVFKWFSTASKNGDFFVYFIIFVYHVLLLMMLLAVFQTIMTHPGDIPFYWGFRQGDTDVQRKRYCLMCNVFKPDRCHHCSVCNTCILNMDHHCPWINTCIGFWNRKYFIQMLFYLNLLIYFSLVINFKYVFEVVESIYHNKTSFKFTILFDSLGLIFIYHMDVAAMFVLTMFFKFHIMLVLENKTTIETIDKKNEDFKSPYDFGYWNNFIQVMGESKFHWFLPIHSFSGQPIGNGIDWTTTK